MLCLWTRHRLNSDHPSCFTCLEMSLEQASFFWRNGVWIEATPIIANGYFQQALAVKRTHGSKRCISMVIDIEQGLRDRIRDRLRKFYPLFCLFQISGKHSKGAEIRLHV